MSREIEEGWRAEAGWEAAVRLLSSSKVEFRVRILRRCMDWRWGGGTAGWLPDGGNMGRVGGIGWVAFGGTTVPVNPKWIDVRPVLGTGRVRWVHELLQAGVPESVRFGVLLELKMVMSRAMVDGDHVR